MSNIHPIMQAALAPFAPQVRHPGMSHHQHNVGGVTLECWLEYTPPQRSTSTDPAYPAEAELCHAYHRNEDIYDILPEWLQDEIENAYLEALE